MVTQNESEELPDETAAAPPRRRYWLLAIAGAVAALVLAFFGWRWWTARNYASTDDAFVGGDMVPVLARVGGYVQSVSVQENQNVRAGEVLVLIDPSELRQRLLQAEAEVAATRSVAGGNGRAGSAPATADAARDVAEAARSAIAEAEAVARKARRDVERLRPLAAQQIISREQFDAAVTAERAAIAQLAAAREKANAAKSQARAAEGDVETARAA